LSCVIASSAPRLGTIGDGRQRPHLGDERRQRVAIRAGIVPRATAISAATSIP
jgi:hypothetical protein